MKDSKCCCLDLRFDRHLLSPGYLGSGNYPNKNKNKNKEIVDGYHKDPIPFISKYNCFEFFPFLCDSNKGEIRTKLILLGIHHELTDALDKMILSYIWRTHRFEGFVFIYRNLSSVLSYLSNQSVKKVSTTGSKISQWIRPPVVILGNHNQTVYW